MSFVYPWFLWALFAISIPIIIHLFHFRRFKTVYFTNVKFLKEVKEQTSARSKLKHLLVLFARILVVAFLVFAFAMPYIPSKNGAAKIGSKDVSIFFDNSFSMSAESEDVRLLEKAQHKTIALQPKQMFSQSGQKKISALVNLGNKNCRYTIAATNDEQGRWIYKAIKNTTPNGRPKAKIIISSPTKIEQICLTTSE